MAKERTPEREQSLLGDEKETTPWTDARERLANREEWRTNWLATVRERASTTSAAARPVSVLGDLVEKPPKGRELNLLPKLGDLVRDRVRL